MSEKRNGPRLTVKASCLGCEHEQSDSYAVQGDSGFQVFCGSLDVIDQSAIGSRRHIGDTTWDTPTWCPLLAQAIADYKGTL